MAKKILYKVRAYHCPRCGSATEPTKTYCDYCMRDLSIRSLVHNRNKQRLLIDCGDYVYFDSIKSVEIIETPQYIDSIYKSGGYDRRFSIEMFLSERSKELLKLNFSGMRNIRFEHLGKDFSYEQKCYISEIKVDDFFTTKINFIGVGESKEGNVIPKDILQELRCPNCGAPVKSVYGACDYCSGWCECEW